MYTQVADKSGKETKLSLVWKFEVEMQDNWYETAVSALPPHRVISVVDWASDSPLSAPIPPTSPEPGTYNVFAWGVNDPSEGNRTVAKENFDKLASPVGWHALPVSVDPYFQRMRVRDRPNQTWRNTTTTWGNNVFAQENWEGANE